MRPDLPTPQKIIFAFFAFKINSTALLNELLILLRSFFKPSISVDMTVLAILL